MKKYEVKEITYNPKTKKGCIVLGDKKVYFEFDTELMSWFQWGAPTDILSITQPIVERMFDEFMLSREV